GLSVYVHLSRQLFQCQPVGRPYDPACFAAPRVAIGKADHRAQPGLGFGISKVVAFIEGGQHVRLDGLWSCLNAGRDLRGWADAEFYSVVAEGFLDFGKTPLTRESILCLNDLALLEEPNLPELCNELAVLRVGIQSPLEFCESFPQRWLGRGLSGEQF